LRRRKGDFFQRNFPKKTLGGGGPAAIPSPERTFFWGNSESSESAARGKTTKEETSLKGKLSPGDPADEKKRRGGYGGSNSPGREITHKNQFHVKVKGESQTSKGIAGRLVPPNSCSRKKNFPWRTNPFLGKVPWRNGTRWGGSTSQ